MNKYLFISIKEEFTKKILAGQKSIELRKARPNILSGDYVIIYCTSPIKAIVGTAKVEGIISHTPREMWKLHSDKLGIDKKGFDQYFNNANKAVGIVLTKPRKLTQKIDLKRIQKQHPKFSPPQTFKYFAKFIEPTADGSFELMA
jgi:predicted transcriptional regulator